MTVIRSVDAAGSISFAGASYRVASGKVLRVCRRELRFVALATVFTPGETRSALPIGWLVPR